MVARRKGRAQSKAAWRNQLRRGWWVHTARACFARFGISLTKGDYEMLGKRIERYGREKLPVSQPDIVLLEYASESRSIYALKHEGLWMPVVFSWEHRVVVTISPPAELQTFRFLPPQTVEEQLIEEYRLYDALFSGSALEH